MTDFSALDIIQHEPEQTADCCIIWLHGLGASGHDFAPITPMLRQATGQAGLRAIYPHAPALAVTINSGMLMPAWYDILATSPRRTINPQHFHDAVSAIQALIQQQIDQGIDSRRIIVAGFSQGGAVAYQAALGFDQQLAGLICLSTYLVDTPNISAANQQLPIFVGHGQLDMVVPMMLGQEAVSLLEHKELTPVWREYPLQHEVSQQELEDVATFIQRIL